MQYFEGKQGDQVTAGVMLVGVGILFLTNSFFPGIFLVVALALVARSLAEGKGWFDNKGALVLLGLWVLFGFNWFNLNVWPLLLIALGAYMLFGDRWRSDRAGGAPPRREDTASAEKPKNDDLL
jgi:membrane-bound ClpP family serine protease